MAELTIGDAAPAFTLDDQNGKPVSLAALKGQPVFIYFYPKPSTPGCTTQSCAVRDALPEIKSNHVTALGISVCEPWCGRGETMISERPTTTTTKIRSR